MNLVSHTLTANACGSRMIQRQVSREVVDGGSVHVWLDLTSKIESSRLVFSQ